MLLLFVFGAESHAEVQIILEIIILLPQPFVMKDCSMYHHAQDCDILFYFVGFVIHCFILLVL